MNYMPQDIFNMSAVMTARYKNSTEPTIEQVAHLIAETDRKRFIDDGFEKDIITAAYKIADAMETEQPEVDLYSYLVQIQFCIKNYRTDGKKIRFHGGLFKSQKSPLPQRISSCVQITILFHVGTLAGLYPVAPRGWSL